MDLVRKDATLTAKGEIPAGTYNINTSQWILGPVAATTSTAILNLYPTTAGTNGMNYAKMGSTNNQVTLVDRYSQGGLWIGVNSESKAFNADVWGNVNTALSSNVFGGSQGIPFMVASAASGASTNTFGNFFNTLFSVGSSGNAFITGYPYSFQVAHVSGTTALGTMTTASTWLVTAPRQTFGGTDHRGGIWVVQYSGATTTGAGQVTALQSTTASVTIADATGVVSYSAGGGSPTVTLNILRLS